MVVRQLKGGIERKPVKVRTEDGLTLTFWWWERGDRDRLLIVSPGFAQHHGTPIMRHLAQEFWGDRDVLGVDYRGMAANPGRYTFGAREDRDLRQALRWAEAQGYREVELIGFSLGAYIALRTLAEDSGPVRRLYFVSGPTRLEDILRTLGPLRQLLYVLLRPHALRLRVWAGSQWLFRWGWPLLAKPDGRELARGLKLPAAFLAGLQDQLVLPQLTRAVFEAVPGRKSWTVFPEGQHAEYMAVTEPHKFLAWMEQERRELHRERRAAWWNRRREDKADRRGGVGSGRRGGGERRR